MRVVFFVGEFTEGGAERVISILANNMIEKGFDIAILKYHNTSNFYHLDKKIKISSVEENTNTRSNTIKNICWLHHYFKNNADIVISFLAPFNILALLANIGNRTPIIVADRNDPRQVPSSKFRRVLRDLLYNFADKVVVQTKHNKEYFSNNIQNKTVVIANPIDIKDNVGIALRTKKENVIVQVARLEKQKNQEMLIEVFSEIKKKYKCYKLVIYGEGNYRKELEKKINSLNLQNDVLLPGNQKDILNKIAIAKLYVCSSNYEGMSNSLIEALGIGLPVISTKVSGTEELIHNGENGFLIDINSKDQLQKAITSLIEDEDKQRSIGENATKIVDNLSIDKITNIWIKTIKDIMK